MNNRFLSLPNTHRSFNPISRPKRSRHWLTNPSICKVCRSSFVSVKETRELKSHNWSNSTWNWVCAFWHSIKMTTSTRLMAWFGSTSRKCRQKSCCATWMRTSGTRIALSIARRLLLNRLHPRRIAPVTKFSETQPATFVSINRNILGRKTVPFRIFN